MPGRWSVVAEADTHGAASAAADELVLRLLWSQRVCSVPCTRLRTDDSGAFVAVGASDGSVAVVDSLRGRQVTDPAV